MPNPFYRFNLPNLSGLYFISNIIPVSITYCDSLNKCTGHGSRKWALTLVRFQWNSMNTIRISAENLIQIDSVVSEIWSGKFKSWGCIYFWSIQFQKILMLILELTRVFVIFLSHFICSSVYEYILFLLTPYDPYLILNCLMISGHYLICFPTLFGLCLISNIMTISNSYWMSICITLSCQYLIFFLTTGLYSISTMVTLYNPYSISNSLIRSNPTLISYWPTLSYCIYSQIA